MSLTDHQPMPNPADLARRAEESVRQGNVWQRPARPSFLRRLLDRLPLAVKVNGCLVLNCAVLAVTVVSVMPEEDPSQTGVVLLSLVLLSAAIFAIVNSTLQASQDRATVLNVQLEESSRQLARVKRELFEAQQLDELTECYNKKRFHQEMHRFVAMGRRSGFRFSLALIRIDQYKAVLSRFGNLEASQVLKSAGQVLKDAVREVDFVARLDEEQFALLLSDAWDDNALIVANRVMEQTLQIRVPSDRDFEITVSIGVADSGYVDSPEEMMSKAGEAQAVAIGEGGNYVSGYQERLGRRQDLSSV